MKYLSLFYCVFSDKLIMNKNNKFKCVCLTLFFLCLENVVGIICNSSPLFKPKENKPTTEKPGFMIYSEGTEANIDCESSKLYHQWYQVYQNSTSKKLEDIGSIPLQTGVKKTRYIITVESFDNNTVIYCENDRTNHDSPKNKYFKTSIRISDDVAPPTIEEPTVLRYSEMKNTLFSCKEYVEDKNYTYVVGVINTTSNIIKTYQTISDHPRLKKTHNGTILCCVYYNVSGTADEKRITRHVAKKTLLVYDDSVRQDSLASKDMISADTETGQTNNQTTTIYITTAVAGILVLLIIIVICKKRCRKRPITNSKVLYVDLDLLRDVRPESISRSGPEEECPYAQIIGVQKPDQ